MWTRTFWKILRRFFLRRAHVLVLQSVLYIVYDLYANSIFSILVFGCRLCNTLQSTLYRVMFVVSKMIMKSFWVTRAETRAKWHPSYYNIEQPKNITRNNWNGATSRSLDFPCRQHHFKFKNAEGWNVCCMHCMAAALPEHPEKFQTPKRLFSIFNFQKRLLTTLFATTFRNELEGSHARHTVKNDLNLGTAESENAFSLLTKSWPRPTNSVFNEMQKSLQQIQSDVVCFPKLLGPNAVFNIPWCDVVDFRYGNVNEECSTLYMIMQFVCLALCPCYWVKTINAYKWLSNPQPPSPPRIWWSEPEGDTILVLLPHKSSHKQFNTLMHIVHFLSFSRSFACSHARRTHIINTNLERWNEYTVQTQATEIAGDGCC